MYIVVFYIFMLPLTYSVDMGDDRYWIGAHEPREGQGWLWRTTNATLDSTYSHWKDDQPNNWDNSQDCAETSKSGFWNDKSCDSRKYILCEYP